MSDDNYSNPNSNPNSPNYNRGNGNSTNSNDLKNNQDRRNSDNANPNNGEQNSDRNDGLENSNNSDPRNHSSDHQNDRGNYESHNHNNENQNRGNYDQNNQNYNNQNNNNQHRSAQNNTSQNNGDFSPQGNNTPGNLNSSNNDGNGNNGNYEQKNHHENFDNQQSERLNDQHNHDDNNSGGYNNAGNFNNGNGGNGNGGNNDNGNKNNNNRNIIIAILATLAVAVAAYFLFFNKKEKEEVVKTEINKKDSIIYPLPIQDTLKTTKPADNGEEGDEEGEYVTESYVVANEAYLRSTPSADAASKVKSMRFGDKVFAKNSESINGYTTVYLSKPANEKNITEQPYYLLESTIVSQYQYAEFKEYFSLAPFSTLASKTKKLIIEKNYNDGTEYKVTQNADRAKNSLAYGDFDKDGIMDIAIVLDNNEKQVSRLLLICTNKATKEPYLAFAENYSDKVKVNTFKKGASVFMNTEDFIPAPSDGILVKGEDVKMAIIYDAGNQKFKTYYQE